MILTMSSALPECLMSSRIFLLEELAFTTALWLDDKGNSSMAFVAVEHFEDPTPRH